MFDDDNRVAGFHQALQNAQQHVDVFKVEAGSGFVQDVQRLSRGRTGQFGRKFHPLAFSSGQGDGALSQVDIPQAHIYQGLQFGSDAGNELEKFIGLADGHFQHVVDILPFVAHGQGVFLVPFSAAHFARYVDRGQEVHLYHLDAGSLALFASASGYVEGESARFETAHFGVRGVFEEGTDVVENARERSGIGTGRAADGALVYLDELVQVLHPLDALVGQRLVLGAVELLLENGHQRFVHQRTLSRSGKTRHADKASQREAHVHRFEVVAGGALQAKEKAVSLAAHPRDGNGLLPLQVIQGNRRADDGMLRRIGIHPVALQEGPERGAQADAAAVFAGAGTHVHQPVGAEHRLGIVLHHHHGIAFVPEGLEGSDELAVVLLVKADGRLVQDVQYIHQPGADLRGQANALALPAGERTGGTVQRQIVQPHIQHKLDTLAKFLEDVPGHVLFPFVESVGDGIQPLAELGHFHRRDFRNGFPVHAEAESLRIQTRTPADRAGDGVFNVVDDPAPAFHLREAAFPHAEKVFGTIDQEAYRLVGQGADGVVEAEIVFSRNGADDVELSVFPNLSQRNDAPVRHGLAAVRDDGIQVYVHDSPEALAMGAVSLRGVEGETVRLRFLKGEAAFRIDQVFGIMREFPAFLVQDRDRALAQVEGAGHGFPDAAVIPGRWFEPVHHQFDEMGLVSVERCDLLQLDNFSVYADFGISAPAHLVEELTVMAFPAADNGREQVALATAVLFHDQVHDAGIGVTDHLPACFRRIGTGALCIQEAQEVVDFRNGPHRGTGVVSGGFLLDGDDGTQAGNFLHLRFFQDAHKMLGIGGEGVHITALPLGIDGVEGQGTFSASAEAGHHYEFPPRNAHGNILQVVGPSASYRYVFLLFHRLAKIHIFHRPANCREDLEIPQIVFNFVSRLALNRLFLCPIGCKRQAFTL